MYSHVATIISQAVKIGNAIFACIQISVDFPLHLGHREEVW
jgi:hypothetical protein